MFGEPNISLSYHRRDASPYGGSAGGAAREPSSTFLLALSCMISLFPPSASLLCPGYWQVTIPRESWGSPNWSGSSTAFSSSFVFTNFSGYPGRERIEEPKVSVGAPHAAAAFGRLSLRYISGHWGREIFPFLCFHKLLGISRQGENRGARSWRRATSCRRWLRTSAPLYFRALAPEIFSFLCFHEHRRMHLHFLCNGIRDTGRMVGKWTCARRFPPRPDSGSSMAFSRSFVFINFSGYPGKERIEDLGFRTPAPPIHRPFSLILDPGSQAPNPQPRGALPRRWRGRFVCKIG